MINLSLTEEELKTILESLLFSSSVDICADWYKEDIDIMLNLLKNIRIANQTVPVENVYVSDSEDNQYSDEHIDIILKYFPELTNKNKNTI
jgi:hypothetical protein